MALFIRPVPSSRLQPAAEAQPAAGMRVYKIRHRAVGGLRGGARAGSGRGGGRSTSAESLTETPGQTPAGGVRLDLQGRFRSYTAATKDEEGRIKVHCLPAAPQP